MSSVNCSIILLKNSIFSQTSLFIDEVYCVRYTPRAWDPSSLQSILNVPLVFRSFAASSQRLKPLSFVYNNNNSQYLILSLKFQSRRIVTLNIFDVILSQMSNCA